MSGSRREKLKPIEYLGFAFACGLFTGLITLMGARDIILALIFFGVAFIVTLVGISTIKLTVKEPGERDSDDGEGPKA